MLRIYRVTVKDDQGVVASVVLFPDDSIQHAQLDFSKGEIVVTLTDAITDFRERNISLLGKDGKETSAKRSTWVSTHYPNVITITDPVEQEEFINGFVTSRGLLAESLLKEFREGTELMKAKILKSKEDALVRFIAGAVDGLQLPLEAVPDRKEGEGVDEYYTRLNAFFSQVKNNREAYPREERKKAGMRAVSEEVAEDEQSTE